MKIIEEIRKLDLPNKEFIIVGGGCLAVRGLRETKDLDIVVQPSLFETLECQGWLLDPVYEQKWGRRRLKRDYIEIYPDMLLESENRFYKFEELLRDADIIEGIAFLSLQNLRTFKLSSGREKDLKDIVLIDSYLASN